MVFLSYCLQCMSNALNILFTSLEQLVGLHQQLHTTLETQQKAMRTANLQMLEGSQIMGQSILKQIRTIEHRRHAAAAQLSRDVGASNLLTSMALAEHLQEPGRSRLTGLSARLRSLTDQIKRDNSILAKISHRVSEQMQSVVELLSGAGSNAGTYARSGRRDAQMGQYLLDAVA